MIINDLFISGLGSTKPKNFKCEHCQKSYIGRAGLSRHYTLNPTHGQMDESELLEATGSKSPLMQAFTAGAM